MKDALEIRLRRIEARRASTWLGIEVIFVPDPTPTDWLAFEAEHAARAPGRQLLFIEFVDMVPQL